MNTQETDRPPAWNELRAPVQIVTANGPETHTRATYLFRHLQRVCRYRVPVMAVFIGGTPADESAVGALNLYLGTAGLTGLARRLGVSFPRTRFDWEGLQDLCGFNESKPLQRSA